MTLSPSEAHGEGAAVDEGDHVPDPRTEPTVSVPRAGRVLGISRNAAYEAAQRGEIPTIRLGRRLVVPSAALLRMLGLGERGAA